jgi:carbonic anhydrase
MKYSMYGLTIYSALFMACQDKPKQSIETGSKQTDTVRIEIKPASASGQSNQVRSEAPDASTKTDQGYALPRFDDGLAQSPINILTFKTEKENKHFIDLRFNDEINEVENLGHTVQLDFIGGNTNIIDKKTYKIKQLHFHTPSEHLIDGMTFPMEMHIVNVSTDQKSAATSEYVVIGMLFKMGRENKFIKEFLDAIPGEENKKDDLKPGTVKLEDLFANISKNELGAYYHYKGSLTTPPYTESVNWIIRKYIFEASPEQIMAIEKIEGDNARHVQALYNRKVESN